MRSRRGLPRAAILKYSGSTDESCVLDFSRIPSSVYTDLFAGLPTFLFSKLRQVEFNRALSIRAKLHGKLPRSEATLFQNSIFIHCPCYDAFLIKILERVLPRCKALNSLSLSDIHVPALRFQDFISTCAISPHLRSLQLKWIPISTGDAQFLFHELSPFKFRTITLISCQLESEVAVAVHEFLGRTPVRDEEWALETLDLRDNYFSDAEMNEFNYRLQQRIDAAQSHTGESETSTKLSPIRRQKTAASPVRGVELSGSSHGRRAVPINNR
jgi:hypothetical protein